MMTDWRTTGSTVRRTAASPLDIESVKMYEKVSILWGMVEYTKCKSQTKDKLIHLGKDQHPITKPLTTVYQPSTITKVK
jgi:hypothetical protein